MRGGRGRSGRRVEERGARGAVAQLALASQHLAWPRHKRLAEGAHNLKRSCHSTTAVAMQLASVSAACPEGTDVTRLVEWQPGILAGDKGGRAIGAAVAALRSGPEDRDRVLHGEALAVRAV